MVSPRISGANRVLQEEDKGLKLISYCYCGRVLDFRYGLFSCPTHKFDYIERPIRRRIGKWSGPTKKYRGGYEA